ncbi:acyltransferase family protein [Actinokineospora sp. HUAS TT18]|uniref:acyltransferase family protein n=1 Tax=Actinokineospora sp. HUAS TT18 TaxID=3447451 RepID=UPI003F5206A3
MSANQARLTSLTGTRFLAVMTVFLYHAILYGGFFSSAETAGLLGAVIAPGGFPCVVFFFVLSGFVLAWSARASDTVPGFWRRRLVKVFPNHLVTTAAAFLLGALVLGTAVGFGSVVNFALLHSFVPDLSVAFRGNLISWSLSCELLFYLSFPFVMMLVRRIPVRALWLTAGGLVAAVWLMPALAGVIPPPAALAAPGVVPGLELTIWQHWFVGVFPPVRMLEFVLGMVLARVVQSGLRLPLSVGGTVAVGIAFYALTPFFPGAFRIAATTVAPIGLILVALATAEVDAKPSVFSSRVMVFLGEITFAFYLLHWLVLDYGHRLLGTTWSTPAALGILLLLAGVTVLLSSGLYFLVERPLMRRFGSSRRAALAKVIPMPAKPPVPPASMPDRLAG